MAQELRWPRGARLYLSLPPATESYKQPVTWPLYAGLVTAPKGLHAAGRRLWRTVTARYQLEPHETELLRRACYLADVCDHLEPRLPGDLDAAREYRLAALALGRLIAGLRLPVETAPGQTRPQRRGPRGPYSLDKVGM
jgi:hypothetical protein